MANSGIFSRLMSIRTAASDYREKTDPALSTDWNTVRKQFNLSPEYIHLGTSQLVASHPKVVRNAIEYYRNALDANPVLYTMQNEGSKLQEVREAIAEYLDAVPDDIALTDSTTMGLSILYNGLNLQPGMEILTTEHEYYLHHAAIYLAAKRTGASVRSIKLYQDLLKVSEEEIIESISEAIRPETRLIALSWVYSATGLKIPVREIAYALLEINKKRSEENQVLFCLDAANGFGVEEDTMPDLGCDFFVTGCHKWLYGPRGTGFICAAPGAWNVAEIYPATPGSSQMQASADENVLPQFIDGKQMTPSGFYAAEHRWATTQAFTFHKAIGKKRIAERVHELNTYCKEGLSQINGVTVHTPMNPNLSSGIVSFEVNGISTEEVVEQLAQQRIIASKSPYGHSYVRFAPGIYNTPEEIDKALQAVRAFV